MHSRVDSIGRLLLRTGALSDETLADVLDEQRHTLPVASLAYVLGYADEETLTRALSRQLGVPGVVLDRCVIPLEVLDGISRDQALRHGLLPVFEDSRRIFVAARHPATVAGALRELQFVRGKTIVPHVALHVVLARTIRAAYRALERGEQLLRGPEADADERSARGAMIVVSDADGLDASDPASSAHEAVVEDVTKELVDIDLVIMEASQSQEAPGALPADDAAVGDDLLATQAGDAMEISHISIELPNPQGAVIDLDGGDFDAVTAHDGPPRVLIVDDDFATRHLLVKELQPQGYVTATASTGGEAVRSIKSHAPDLVVIDVMLPEIDGFQVCRAIKQSHKYQHIPVILMSAVIDSGRVTGEVLRRYGADAYFEKPLNTDKIKRRIKDLLAHADQDEVEHDEGSFQRALALYKGGDIDAAVAELRAGLRIDPLSAKHHFVLANLLQKKAMLYEAIDEYEATVDLKPDYFPALTRLAYLYYKKGFSAKAIEMWRRSLPHCADPSLRQNIEIFMRRLIADMQAGEVGRKYT